jgi:hypothetical protein
MAPSCRSRMWSLDSAPGVHWGHNDRCAHPRAQRSAQPLHGAPWGVTAAVTTALARLAFVPISRTRQAPCGRQPRAAAASIVLDIAPMQHRSADHGAH